MDYASASMDRFKGIAGEIKHIRSVAYVRGEFWIVVDRIVTDSSRTVETLWHWHPENNVVQDRMIVKTENSHGNLAVIPLGKRKFNLELIKGQENPEIQGWYSPEYNIFGPNTASIYRTEISGSTNFVWLLLPSGNKMPKIKAKMLSENDDEVRIQVKSKEKKWTMTIPFMNSARSVLIED